MVVLVVHLVTISTVKGEGNTPVWIDIHSPLTLPPALERMKPKPGRVEIANARRCLKPGENPTDLWRVIRVQGPRVARFEVPLQPAVPETDDHP